MRFVMSCLITFTVFLSSQVFLLSESELKSKDENSYYWYLNGSHFQKKGDIPKAVEALKKALDLNPENVKASELLYQIRKEHEIVDEITGSQSVDFTQKGESFQWYVNAEYHFQKNQYEKAMETVKKSLKLNPFNIKAITLLNKLREKMPETTVPVEEIKPEKVIGKSEEENRKDDVLTWLQSGKFYLSIKKHDKARLAFEKVLSMDPENTEAKELLEKNAHFGEIEKKKTVIQKSSNPSSYWYWLGKYYEKQKELKKALLCYQRSQIGKPDEENIKQAIDRVKSMIYFDMNSGTDTDKTLKSIDFELISPADSIEEDQRYLSATQRTATSETETAPQTEIVFTPETASTPSDSQDDIDTDVGATNKNPIEVISTDFDEDGLVFDRGNVLLSSESAPSLVDSLKKAHTEFTPDAPQKIFSLEQDKLISLFLNKQKPKEDDVKSTINIEETKTDAPDNKSVRNRETGENSYKDLIIKWENKLIMKQDVEDEEVKEVKVETAKSEVVPEEIKAQIKSYFEKAQILLEARKNEEGLKNMRIGYITSIENNPGDIESLYYLMLIYYKQKKFDMASLLLFQLGKYLEEFRNIEKYSKISSITSCWIRQVVIQSAINNYNNDLKTSVYGNSFMTYGNFSTQELLKKNYLLETPVEGVSLDLEIQDRQFNINYDIVTYACDNGKYRIDSSNILTCSSHGTTPFLLNSKRRIVDESAKRNNKTSTRRRDQTFKDYYFWRAGDPDTLQE